MLQLIARIVASRAINSRKRLPDVPIVPFEKSEVFIHAVTAEQINEQNW